MRGGILLSLTLLLPIVGWVVLPIWALVSGLGAFLLSLAPPKQTIHASPSLNLNPAQGAA